MPRVTEKGGLAEGVIKARWAKARDREGWLSLIGKVIVLLAALWLLFSFVFCLHRVRGNDMYPAMQDGDVVLAWRLQGSYNQKDVVVYEAGGKQRVGRVLAKEGDVVDLTDDGQVTVNGTPEDNEIYQTQAGKAVKFPYLVPKGKVFVLGDFRTQATDSRKLGAISTDDVEGVTIGLLRRRKF
ncbi:signal peptidase I [Parafannyhessea umbonata]|uniref:signal peptidase I n=1 Tax=Parafannyhessea umbonata TaxID=604330 RepID=UPI002A7EBB83|nr:signal peptidase I [Parafannyhessea umbonata]MDY4014479.1 signal peptidase I [Parafannyhessea umbonata]